MHFQGQITVFTGMAGSGKSSLVFDTSTAEVPRRLDETHGFQGFLPHDGQPDVDRIEHLNAPISIDQNRMGGGACGEMLSEGTPQGLKACARSLTGQPL
ncbi:hypothetical protein GCM10010840_18040 [Deinococcus aerolatus]|uniref:UvrABC system protein A n=1 Tax=Deinococcus aerolatus TaxID=522487 RepID=A0ABQ2G8R3_9DEIO|nr:hypothetical protein [Deinococcus aerolatus]GGL80575.1 hypothetical protein GCM10010840_18040 [Deinococcus aerolatus]